MDLLPILGNDHSGDSDRNQHGNRYGNFNGKVKRQQRYGDQRLPKSKDGTDQRRQENDQDGIYGDKVDGSGD